MQHNFFENIDILLYYNTIKEKWYIKNKGRDFDYDLTLTTNLSSFLQIFYEDPINFFADLLQKAKDQNLNEKILDRLPFKTSIIFCIENKMFFWLELSLKWLEFINIDEELNKAIKTVVKNSRFPQNIRHKFMKVIKK